MKRLMMMILVCFTWNVGLAEEVKTESKDTKIKKYSIEPEGRLRDVFSKKGRKKYSFELGAKQLKGLGDGLISSDVPTPGLSWVLFTRWSKKESIWYFELGSGFWNNEDELYKQKVPAWTFYVYPMLGVKIKPKNAYVKAAFGPAIMTEQDNITTSGFLQFISEFGVGLDKDAWSAGLIMQHFSNGGYKQPNNGRNYLGFEMAYSFF